MQQSVCCPRQYAARFTDLVAPQPTAARRSDGDAGAPKSRVLRPAHGDSVSRHYGGQFLVVSPNRMRTTGVRRRAVIARRWRETNLWQMWSMHITVRDAPPGAPTSGS